jgi:PAS domain S-box-containing protein
MDIGHVIIIASLTFQIVVALLALRLIPLSGRKIVWVLMALASILMAYRRWVALRNSLPPFSRPLDIEGELIALIISLLMLAVVLGISNLLRSLQQTEARNRASESRFRAIYEQSPVGIALANLNGSEIEPNPALQQMLGYSAAELHPKTFNEITYAPDLPVLECVNEQAKQGQAITFDSEKRYLRKDGTALWVHVSGSSLVDEQGKPNAVLVIVQNIASRKTAESDLRASEERYRQIVNTAQEGIWLIDQQANTTFVNQKMADMLGYTTDEMQGKHLFYFMNDQMREDAQKRLAEREQGLNEQHDFCFQRKDGQPLWAIVATNALLNGSGMYQGALAMITNISDRKQVDDALHRSEANLQAIFNSLSAALFLLDSDQRIIAYNRAGADWAVMMGGNDLRYGSSLEEYLPDDVYQKFQDHFLMALNGQFVTLESAVGLYGSNRQIEFRYVPVVTNQHDIIGVCLMIEDVTLRKQAAKQATELALEKERLNILSDFITVASHEFRTPLSIINSSLYLLRRSTDPERVQKRIEQIEEQANAILMLVNAMVTMVNLDRMQVAADPIHTALMVETCVKKVGSRYDKRNIVFDMHIEATLPPLYGDLAQLSMALENVLDNAARFNRDGGHVQVDVTPYHQHEILFSIRDDGPGISEQHLPHLFELFYRDDAAHTTRGLGLGLPIAQKIVGKHDGRIEVSSQPGTGSTFRIILPASEMPTH